MDQITITENFAKEIMSVLNESHDRACVAVKREITAFTEALNGIDTRRNNLFDLFVAKIIDEETYREQAERLKEQRLHFTSQLEKAQLAINGGHLKNAKQILELATEAKSLWITRSVEEKRDFLNRILSNQVLDGTTVRYELKKPFSTLAEMKKKAEWRPQRESSPCLTVINS